MATYPNPGFPNPQDESVRSVDKVLGYATTPEASTLLPSDFPNLQVPGSEIDDPTRGLRNLTNAEISAGEITPPVTQVTRTITLMGGGYSGSIFAAMIDGTLVAENLYSSDNRPLTQVARDVARLLPLQLPYLQADPSGTTVLVRSTQPSLSIVSATPPLPLGTATIYQGPQTTKAGDYVQVVINSNLVTIRFDGTEILPDLALQKVYNGIVSSSASPLVIVKTYFVNSYADSYLYIQPLIPLTVFQVLSFGQIRLKAGPLNAGPNNFTFTVS